jgi:hypothetical protein
MGKLKRNREFGMLGTTENTKMKPSVEVTTFNDSPEPSNLADNAQKNTRWIIAVHGGAAQGYLSDAALKKYNECMKEACRRSAVALDSGCRAEEAVAARSDHKLHELS